MDIRAVTYNVDFTLRPDEVGMDLARVQKNADIILLQEAKNVVLRNHFDEKWGVHQFTGTDAAQGSAVAWRKSVAKRKASGKKIGTKPYGRGILTRYIVWVRLEIDGRDLVVGSVHLPPKRYWGFVYDVMVKSMAQFVAGRKAAVLLGGDWNKIVTRATDLQGLARKIGGSMRGVGIDGFLLVGRGKWKYSSMARKLFGTRSDHDPVIVTIRAV